MVPTRIFTVFFPVSVSLLPGCCTLGAFPSALLVLQSCLGQCLLGAPLKLPTPAALTLCTRFRADTHQGSFLEKDVFLQLKKDSSLSGSKGRGDSSLGKVLRLVGGAWPVPGGHLAVPAAGSTLFLSHEPTEPRCQRAFHQGPAIYDQGESVSECGHIRVSVLGYCRELVGEIP